MRPEQQFLRADVAAAWAGQDPLQAAFALQGEVYRDVAGRRTLKVDIAGQNFFVKLHSGVGMRELLKNWLQFKRPVVGAFNEFSACAALFECGIPAPVPAAYAQDEKFVSRRSSFVLCEALAGVTSLEDLTDAWPEAPPDPRLRTRLLYAVALFARRFHAQGFVHRDFYICHLLATDALWRSGSVELSVLDLHRAQRFAILPSRWRKRDLAALLFSTLDLGFSQREWLRFVRLYCGRDLRLELRENGRFWRAVRMRADKLYREGLRKGIVKGHYTP